MITDHPFLDNNGASYRGGVCVPRLSNSKLGECGKRKQDHSHRVTLRYPGTRSKQQKVVPVKSIE